MQDNATGDRPAVVAASTSSAVVAQGVGSGGASVTSGDSTEASVSVQAQQIQAAYLRLQAEGKDQTTIL